MEKNKFYNAHHSPIGAFASFTLGYKGGNGGLGLELDKPAEENVFIGLERKDKAGQFEAFPFFGSSAEELARFGIGNDQATVDDQLIKFYQDEEITRELKLGTDTWTAKDMTFKIYNPVTSVPDPETADDKALKKALLPAVFAKVTIDNTGHDKPRKAFFGYQGNDRVYAMRRLNDTSNGEFVGVGQGPQTAIVSNDEGVIAGLGFSIDKVLSVKHEVNYGFGLGLTGALLMEVPANEKREFTFAICFYKGGIVTSGMDTEYTYTRYFSSIEKVASYALENADVLTQEYEAANAMLEQDHLNEEQKYMLAHSIKSYYGNTQLLDDMNGNPIWIVNEGEYRMMNTFDLMVDQLFFELKFNPWTVKNELELFINRYSYRDEVRFPNDEELHPGGISFTHDMGVSNVFSRPGHSAYEVAGITGCFSYMTHEQLINWLCSMTVYVEHTKDTEFLNKHMDIVKETFQSMLNRDNPDPEKRNGIMALDSSRTEGGAEITTYDSLDVSLGQARNNIYIASKCWGVYVSLEKLFRDLGENELSEIAADQAEKCAKTLSNEMTEGGYIPAVITEGNDSKIIPAIEGLVFPYFTGCKEALDENGKYGYYIKTLKEHITTILKPGTCLFEDGGWKLSSTSDNSWLSKIYLCQFVYREILGFPWDEVGHKADKAHVGWLTDPELSYWSWSDQIIAGKITASKYYPRGVTSILWLQEGK
ncbi:glycoside hydrolase family 52 protein [Evansella tamaricis]|uniref:Glycoside hydrolase family 52 protein n=1 Tax=Evansella tamaricis TaxID=2069301 RepID=A0ABS6JG20_9BACI|nr:glycoside hydrolase family 52 protein [Evansella tamaricis]MBU9712604.1 glycoside hydrolase family 52 protein [Evansella tamaricis]